MSLIKLYSTTFCPYCVAAKRLLSHMKLPFEEIDLTGDWDARAELRVRSGQRTVPQIWIGETHIGGYTDLAALKQRGELTALLASEGIQA